MRFVKFVLLVCCSISTAWGASQISDYLYLGDMEDLKNVKTLQTNQITLVISVVDFSIEDRIEVLKELGIDHRLYPIEDDAEQDILSYFEQINDEIQKHLESNAEGKVLVHCKMGISRSASIVVAHLMKQARMSYSDAYAHVKSRRRCVHPNYGFVEQLKRYESSLLTK